MFRIGDFSKLARVSVRMLRHYDALGLLLPARVDPRTGYRYYSADQLPRLNRIVALRDLGFSLDQIAGLLDEDVPAAELRGMLGLRRAELEERVLADRWRLARVESRLRAIERDGRYPPHEVVLRRVPPRLMATVRERVPSLGPPISRLFDEAEAHVARHRARSADSPLSIFHDPEYRETDLDIEVAVPVSRRVAGGGRVTVREVEGVPTAACAVYAGGYEQMSEVLNALRGWADGNGWAASGAVREVYLRFGADHADELRLPKAFLTNQPTCYVTEVQMPVEPRKRLRNVRKSMAIVAAIVAAQGGELLGAQNRPGDAGEATQCEPPIVGVQTLCGFVDTERGYRLRTIVTKPDRVRRRLPAVLFVQWLSCDPVTIPRQGGDGFARVLRGMIQRSGVVVARTEKPGLGDSGGPACGDLGYDEELAGHRAAFEALRRSEHVHPDSIFIFGASMGGTMAPLVARDHPVRGILVWGTTGVTWAEHMIGLDRRVLELRGVTADSVHALIGEHMLFHALYLADQRAPSDVIAERPRLAATWRRMLGTDSTLRQKYGRPIRFHHEAQRADWEGAWAAVTAPVLVVRGEYDWIMAEFEHRRIAEVVNARRPGRAYFVTYPKMGHGFLVHPSQQAAFRNVDGSFAPGVLDVFLGWLSRQRAGRAERSER